MTAPPSKTAHEILRIAGEARAGKSPHLPPIEALETLARAYLAMSDADRLGQAGQVYVSLAAAREYAESERIAGEESARRELTELLLDARKREGRDGEWRLRSTKERLDLTAHVVVEGRLYVVVHVNARGYAPGGRRG